jgi:hypothetical protein
VVPSPGKIRVHSCPFVVLSNGKMDPCGSVSIRGSSLMEAPVVSIEVEIFVFVAEIFRQDGPLRVLGL